MAPLQPRRKAQPRREALLNAAVEVVGTHGLAGTTHRTVTEAAGVPLATASYYFSSIGELVAEALQTFVQRRAAEMASMDLGELHGVLTPGDIAGWYAAKVMELDVPHRLAFYEVLVNAPRSPELAGPAREALATYQQATEAGLAAVGAPADPRQSRAFVALAVGFGLLHLVDPGDDDADQLVEGIRDLFLGQERSAADPEGVAERLATPAQAPADR
ncbi:TetR/AcrR family transcriptional regulator [Sporichthya polymorpha]|uniref:TetR/AcrR family transcriptional regulator n=1 Tax=Sporichthya polymorpha TaxID=35751 RepID=UPI00035F52E9|nr:TetR family transcriptional regulator [Sporichthya polymorpha]